VDPTSSRNWYLSGLFLLLMSNGISACIAAIGIRGIAFYHVQAVLLVLCISQFAVLVIGGRAERRLDSTLFNTIVASALYTILSGFLLLRFVDVFPEYVALTLHTLLFYPTTALLMLGCWRMDTAKGDLQTVLPGWLSWAAAVVVLFGWLQFIVQDPILKVTNSENVSKLVESNLLGTFRPPSFFESSFQYGLFSVLVFCLAFAQVMCGKKRRTALVLASLGVSGVLISQTRNVFLCGACTVATFWFLRRGYRHRKRERWLRFAPAMYLLAAVSVMAYAVSQFIQSGLAKTEDLADASSTWARVSSWQRAWETVVHSGSAFDAVFGYGITQAGHASDYRALYPIRGEGLFIDSTFVNLFLLQGVLGLFFFLAIWILMWRRLLRKTFDTWEPLTVGVTAFFSAFLAAGVFNILNGQWWGVTLSLVLVVLSSGTRKECGVCAA
jgi:hypothetical protein